jgi:lysophospholipase L1-like esterase
MKNKNVILFGDSVFFSVGASSRHKGCGYLLKKMWPGNILIRAKAGETSKDAIVRIKKDISGMKDFDIVVILFGNNDCKLNSQKAPLVSLENFELNLSIITNQIREEGMLPMLCNLQPIDSAIFFKTYGKENFKGFPFSPYEWQARYSNMCHSAAKHNSVSLIDIRSQLEKYGKDVIAQDGLHPNDKGHNIIKEALAESIKNAD